MFTVLILIKFLYPVSCAEHHYNIYRILGYDAYTFYSYRMAHIDRYGAEKAACCYDCESSRD